MRIHYYSAGWDDSLRNLGDYLTVLLLKALGIEPEPPKEHQPVLFGVGSILGPAHYNAWDVPRIVVWGSGVLDVADKPHDDRLDVRAVRGPLTAAKLSIDVPLGDPGLLVPELLDVPKFSSTGTVYVSHCGTNPPLHPRGYDSAVWMRVHEDDALDTIGHIAAAEFVVSESLHGCVLAQAFGVPWCAAARPHVGLQYKWEDWAAFLGLPKITPVPIGSCPAAAQRWWERIGRHAHVPDLRPLLGAFPRSLEDG